MQPSDLLVEVSGLVRTYLASLPSREVEGKAYPANPVIDFPYRREDGPVSESLAEYLVRKLNLVSPRQATGLVMAAAAMPGSGLRLGWMKTKGGKALYTDRYERPHATVSLREAEDA